MVLKAGVERRRGNQQWLMDYLVRVTGQVQHFERDERDFPASARSYQMIPRHMARVTRHQEAIARAAEAQGHRETALEAYFKATLTWHRAQHPIYEDDNRFKIAYYQRLQECYDRVMALSGYPIERVEVPWEGVTIQCNLHLLPDRRRAPVVLFVPGMDMVKEMHPNPLSNLVLARGMHCLSMDGPGQGASNLRQIRVTADNYPRAVAAVIDFLAARPEVDGGRIALMGMSMGSYWATRAAAADGRVRALASGYACYGPQTAIFELASPRFKQMFMYMSGIHDEEEFDRMAAGMTTAGIAGQIRCPSLMVVSEYDQLCYLEDSLATFEALAGPKELWVLEDEFHHAPAPPGLGGVDTRAFMTDWLHAALAGRVPPGQRRVVVVSPRSGAGPYTEGSRDPLEP